MDRTARPEPSRGQPETPAPRISRRLVTTAAALTTAAIALALAKVPFGVPSEWVTEYAEEPQLHVAWRSLLVTASIVGLCAWTLWYAEARRWRRALFVALLTVMSFVAHLVVACAGEFGFSEFVPAVRWDRAMGPYYKEGLRITSAAEYMATLKTHIRGGYQHSNTHPPGPGLLFYAGIQLVRAHPPLGDRLIGVACALAPSGEDLSPGADVPDERVRWASALLIGSVLCLASALAVVPTYWLGVRLSGHTGGVLCAGLTSLLPSAMLFNPGVDQLMVVLSVLLCASTYVCIVSSRRHAVPAAALLGLMLYLAFFFSLAFLVNVALCGLCAIVGAALSPRAWRDVCRSSALAGAVAAATFLLLSLLFWLLFRYDTLGALWAVYTQNDAFNVHSKRTYWKWLLANPVQGFVFSGCSLSTLLCFGLAADLRRLASRTLKAVTYSACFAAVLALLWLTGKNLGEVDRLWVFLMPLAAVAGAASLRDTLSRHTATCLLSLQALQLIIFRAGFDVYATAGYLHELLR